MRNVGFRPRADNRQRPLTARSGPPPYYGEASSSNLPRDTIFPNASGVSRLHSVQVVTASSRAVLFISAPKL